MLSTKSTTYTKPSGARLNRGDKAKRIVANGGVHPRGDSFRYDVRSESGQDPYLVTRIPRHDGRPERWECRCLDFRRHFYDEGDQDHVCKHILAVYLYRAIMRQSWRASVSA